MIRLALPLVFLAALCAPAAATNTNKKVTLQVTLHSGKVYKGRLKFKKDSLRIGRRKVEYRDISSISMVPWKTKKELLARFERRKKRVPAGDVKALIRLARWAWKVRLNEEAFETYQQVVKLDPDHAEGRRGIGEVRSSTQGWVKAVEVIKDRRRKLGAKDHDKLVDLAAFSFKHMQRRHGLHYLIQVLLDDIFHKRGLRMLKPYTDLYRQKTKKLLLPFSGDWKASLDRTRHHQKKSYAVYALDLTKVDADGRHHSGSGKKLTDHYAFGAPFYAVADGRVIEVREGFPDNKIGKIGGRYEKHNGVSIDHGNGEVSWYVHAKQGSITVKTGDMVKRGQKLGTVGNSGGSAIPHLHFTLVAFRGISVPWYCEDYEIVAPDGTPIPITRSWPREGWTIRAKTPKQPKPAKKTGQATQEKK